MMLQRSASAFMSPTVLVTLALGACGNADSDPAPDTSFIDTANDVAFIDTAPDADPAAWSRLDAPPTASVPLVVGTGTTTFQALGDPPVFYLERGNQGLQHIWVSVRAPVPRAFHRITLALGTPGESLVEPFQQNIPFTADGPADASGQALGILLVVPDAQRATARATWDLHVRLDTAAGTVGRLTFPVQIVWP